MRKSLLFSIAAIVLYLALLLWMAPPAKGQPPPPLSQRVAFVATDPTGSCIDWPSPNASPLEYNYVGNVLWGCSNGAWAVIGQGGGGGGTGTTNILAKFLSATTIGNSSVSDDGVTTAVTENFSLGTNGLMSAYPNSSSGTVAFTLTKLDNSSNAIQILTTDTTSAYGVCVIGCAAAATSTTALIAVAGQVQCLFDNQTVVRDFVVASTAVAGDCHDAGATEPTGVQVIGRVVTLNAGTGTTGIIALFSPDTATAVPPVKTFTIGNANPGTVVNELAKITGAPSAATIAAITDVGGIIGICSGGCGNSGTATILQSGAALCVFDGATTAGDYVQNSTTNAGQCHDAGATYPVPSQVVGRVTSTNGGAGTYGILVFPPESSNPATATIAPGSANAVTKYTAANALGPSGCTIDSSNNEVCPGSMTTGSGGGKTGYALINGKTSGGQGFAVSDIAGTATLYLIPAAPGNGNFLKDIGSATCPTLPSGAPTACEQLSWASAGGGTVTSIATTSPITGGTITTTGTIGCATCVTNNSANTYSGGGTQDFTADPVLVATQAASDNSTKAASTAYVTTGISNAIAGVNPAVAVLAASTANIVGTYNNGASGIGAFFTVTATGAFTLDGIAINTIGQRVLLKDQSTGFQNGIYTATIVGSTGISPVFTRALDYDAPSDINSTGAIPVQSGTVNTTTSWLLTSTVNAVGTDALTYVKFSVNPTTVLTAAANLVGSNLVQAAASDRTTSDSGIATANVVTAPSAATGSKQVCVASGASKTCSYIDFPDFHYFPSANCVNAVPGSAWSTASTPASACRAGTNNKEGFLTWGASDTAQFSIGLPLDWDSATNPSVSLQLASTDATNGHTIIMQVATACGKGDGTTTDDVAFNTAQSLGTVTLNGNANREWKTTLANITMTGCSAGGILRLQLSRTTDTATNVQIYGLGITIPRLLTVQAN